MEPSSDVESLSEVFNRKLDLKTKKRTKLQLPYIPKYIRELQKEKNCWARQYSKYPTSLNKLHVNKYKRLLKTEIEKCIFVYELVEGCPELQYYFKARSAEEFEDLERQSRKATTEAEQTSSSTIDDSSLVDAVLNIQIFYEYVDPVRTREFMDLAKANVGNSNALYELFYEYADQFIASERCSAEREQRLLDIQEKMKRVTS